MRDRGPTLSTYYAIVAIGATICATVSAVGSAGVASRGLVITMCEAIAVILATKYAADNLRQLREGEEAKLEPKLIVALRQTSKGIDQLYKIEIHDYGASMAVGVRAEFRMFGEGEFDDGRWHPLELDQSFVLPNQHLEADLRADIWLLVLTEYVDIRVTYSGATRPNMQSVWRFPVEHAKPALVGSMVVQH